MLPIEELDFCLMLTRFRFMTWISCLEKCPLSVYSSRAFCWDGSALTNLDYEPLLWFDPIIWPSCGVDIDEIRKLPLLVVLEIGVCSTISPNGPNTPFVCLYYAPFCCIAPGCLSIECRSVLELWPETEDLPEAWAADFMMGWFSMSPGAAIFLSMDWEFYWLDDSEDLCQLPLFLILIGF